MMYKDGFIACCKVDGKILREDAGVVTLPFGCEYSVLLKNLTSVRAQVKVSVDGTDATEGTWLIVPANGELELERYIRNGNFDRGNRFKFIERTGQIEANKGIGASDGLIRVEYKSEIVQEVRKTVVEHVEHIYRRYPYWPHYPYYPYPHPWYDTITCNSLGGAESQLIKSTLSGAQSDGNMGGGQAIGGINQQSVFTANMNSVTNSSAPAPGSRPPLRPTMPMGRRSSGPSGSSARMGSIQAKAMRSLRPSASAGPQRKMNAFTDVLRGAPLNDVGITVPGSESTQKFVTGDWFKTEATSHVIILQLRGMLAGKAVKTAVTVKSKAKCETCGTPNKSNMKFCGKCGTSLNLI